MLNLSGLLEWAGNTHTYANAVPTLPGAGEILRLSIVEGAKPWLLAAVWRSAPRPMLVLTAREKRAREVADEIAVWLGTAEGIACLPEPDAFFYEAIPSDMRTRRARLQALQLLANATPARPPIVVASVRSLLELVVGPAALRGSMLALRRGQRIKIDELLLRLVAVGYRNEPLVEEWGTFAHRGGIVDLYALGLERPVRLDFFGDELESIRFFDPMTQRSFSDVDALTIGPAREVWPDALPEGRDVAAALDVSSLRPDYQQRWAGEIGRLTQANGVEIELLAPCFVTANVIGYLPEDAIVVLDEPQQLLTVAQELANQAEQLREQLASRGELPAGFPVPYQKLEGILAAAERFGRIDVSWQTNPDGQDPVESPAAGAGVGLRQADSSAWETPPVYGGRLKTLLDDSTRASESGDSIVIVSQQASRLSELCRERDIHVATLSEITAVPHAGTITLVQGSLTDGFGLRSPKGRSLVLTDHEIFGWSKPARVARRRAPAREAFVADLTPGDFVVHVEHGVGRFGGLVKMGAGGIEREYLLLEYADGDRLFVPTDHSDRVNRYVGVGDHAPALNRLGGTEWARAKARVKAAAEQVARELLDINSARELAAGHAFGTDTVWQQELEASFPYVETVDQLQAVAEVKSDMEQPKPMDRLICGDVGYGKTEVALRAAFKAVMDARQVAILVPTTVLAQQHFNTFRERMQAFPMRLEVLSRFRSGKEQHAVVEALKAGAVDICIGTHRLLQKDVSFRNLGLVIIDEEQRFGVMHKERLKRLRREVDVLTLSATPIPRTLHMALVGLRDISTMETPPEERLPIKTYVAENDDRLVREAIVRELERGGQVYFVHNRVQTIYQAARRVEDLVPVARVAVGHGQLPEDQLERVMLEFALGKHDVLVCSTIIESGLDIPNVNTIVIDQADRLGLAQMYQLRGRVGRGANRAYAYFLFPPGKQLTETAEKRLRTIFEATELGAGFRIAMKDLEIRGAGNLLGAEQHGHVAAVGFDLYCRLLADAVEELQGKVEQPMPEVRLDLQVAAHIPASYVSDETLRLKLYQRMAAIRTEEDLGSIAMEMRDRFGDLPRVTVNLIYLLQMKLLAGQASVVEVWDDGSDIVLRLAAPERIERAVLQRTFGPRLTIGHSMLRLRRAGGEAWMSDLELLLGALAPRAPVAIQGLASGSS